VLYDCCYGDNPGTLYEGIEKKKSKKVHTKCDCSEPGYCCSVLCLGECLSLFRCCKTPVTKYPGITLTATSQYTCSTEIEWQLIASGTMSYYLKQTLKESKYEITYDQLLTKMNETLKKEDEDTATMSAYGPEFFHRKFLG